MLALIIDDDIDVADALEVFLKLRDFEVVKRGLGKDGMKAFHESRPDVVFLDIMLPDGDGIEMLREMKASDENAAVVIMTGYKDAEKVVSALRHGALDCLLKPFSASHIENNVLPRIKPRKK